MSGSGPIPTGVKLRPGRPKDAPELGKICYDAFFAISNKHGYPCDFPSPEAAADVLKVLLNHPKFYSVVAESFGEIIGSNFLDERGTVTGVGPITVQPNLQNTGVGRQLMLDVMKRSDSIGAAGIRLVQAAYHARSLALYTKLGFETRETLTNFAGEPPRKDVAGREVRGATEKDVQSCDELCRSVHGHSRSGDLADSIKGGYALVVESGGHVTGYSTGVGFFGHTVGESNDDVIAMISHVEGLMGPGILVPTRNYGLMKWCLANGLRINQQMTLMTMGLYNEPRGSYLPSVLF